MVFICAFIHYHQACLCLNIHSESCQFLDITCHNLLSNEQNRAYSSKHVGLHENFLKEKLATREKLQKFVNEYKIVLQKKRS